MGTGARRGARLAPEWLKTAGKSRDSHDVNSGKSFHPGMPKRDQAGHRNAAYARIDFYFMRLPMGSCRGMEIALREGVMNNMRAHGHPVAPLSTFPKQYPKPLSL